MRPIFEGGWNQPHVDWFKDEFKRETGEIDARKVQQRFGSRIGDNFPGSHEKSYVIRDLMRCVVEGGHARVTQGFSLSKDYRVKMVSESYPYVDKVFDDAVFSDPLIGEPLRTYVDVMVPIVETGKLSLASNIARLDDTSKRFRKAFHYHQYCGGDIESVFEEFHERYIEEYVLESFEMIYMYKLMKTACNKIPEYQSCDYNGIFASTFHFKFVSKLLKITKPGNRYSKTYTDRNNLEILAAITTNNAISQQRVMNMEKTMSKALGIVDDNLSLPDFVHCFASGGWLVEMTKDSGDPEIGKARADWINRLAALVKYSPKR
jgi:hypothetical protein